MFSDIKKIRIEDYNYPLPDERIAKYPLQNRDESKLLIYDKGVIQQRLFKDLPSFLDKNSLLVFNNTKVIQARLQFRKKSGANIEIFCLEPIDPVDYALMFQSKGECVWKCMVGNSNKWKEGNIFCVENDSLCAERLSVDGNTSVVRFSWENKDLTFADILDSVGELPIPPYLHRKTEESDKRTYQTVYSKIKGSVAAPTAGLHFTSDLIDRIRKNGVEIAEVTLHVGAGTFQPVKSEEIGAHAMHSETVCIRKSTIVQLREKLGHIVAVGTTSVRTLESLFFVGKRIRQQKTSLNIEQWEPYDDLNEEPTPYESLTAILEYMTYNQMEELHFSTQIIIVPGYSFKIVKDIITNFHQPQSTLLLLVSAYLKGDWRKIYDYALANDFRFLSYGDSNFLKM